MCWGGLAAAHLVEKTIRDGNELGPSRSASRPMISIAEASGLERTFKVLANATRLRLLHALVKCPGLSVTELARLG